MNVVRYLCEEAKWDASASAPNGGTPPHKCLLNGHMEVPQYLCRFSSLDRGSTDVQGVAVVVAGDTVPVCIPLTLFEELEHAHWDEVNELWLPSCMRTLEGTDGLLVCATSPLTLFASVARGFVNTSLWMYADPAR